MECSMNCVTTGHSPRLTDFKRHTTVLQEPFPSLLSLPFPSCILLLGNVIAFWFSISCAVAVAGEPLLYACYCYLATPPPPLLAACCLCMQRMINKCVSHSAYAGSTLISKHVDISIKKYKSLARATSSTSQQHPPRQQQLQL